MIRVFFPKTKTHIPKSDYPPIKNLSKSSKVLIIYKSLIFFITIVSANTSKANLKLTNYKYHKKSKCVLMSIDAGIAQRKMVYSINSFKQKYKELGLRVHIDKELTTYLSVGASYFTSIDHIGRLMNADWMKDNYYHSLNTQIIQLSTHYNYFTTQYLGFHAKSGIGIMSYNYILNVDGLQMMNEREYLLTYPIGVLVDYKVISNISIGVGTDYFFTKKQQAFSYTYIAASYNFSEKFFFKSNRKCPTW